MNGWALFGVPRYHRYHPWERSGGGDEVARFHTLPLYTSIFIFKWYLVPLSTKRRVTDVKPRVPLRRSKWYQVVPSGTEEGGVGLGWTIVPEGCVSAVGK